MTKVVRLSREVRVGVHGVDVPAPGEGGSNGFAGNPMLAGLAPFVTIRVTVSGEPDGSTGMLVNIKVIDAVVREAAVEIVRRYAQTMPLALARLARELFAAMTARLSNQVVEGVQVAVSPYLQVAVQREELPMVRLSQRFEFSAAHRLHSATLSEAENWEVFGRCNNPNGHGHNYELEVIVMGPPDEKTGMVMPVAELQRIVKERVIEVFDHKHLNLDCAEFREAGGMNPTVENIARVLYGRLKGAFSEAAKGGVKLSGVRVWETPKTMCEYGE